MSSENHLILTDILESDRLLTSGDASRISQATYMGETLVSVWLWETLVKGRVETHSRPVTERLMAIMHGLVCARKDSI